MGDRTCTVPGCNRPHRCKGFCGAHYGRVLANGTPGPAEVWNQKASVPERFWLRVDVGDCWLWTGGCDFKGYGNFAPGGGIKTQRAHRWAWEHLVGPISDGMVLDHLCRVRRCVNPDHLRVVSVRENTLCSPIAQAAVAARRTHCPKGHPYDEANTYVSNLKSGRRARACRTCHLDMMKRKRLAHGQP